MKYLLAALAVLMSGGVLRAGPTTAESDCLTDIVQLTSGFDRAGEAYFSHDMKWIIFQAVPPGEQIYQMHVAALKFSEDHTRIVGIGAPRRLSPPGTWNSCGNFSPDDDSLIFATTTGKTLSEVPQSGYQRQGGNYRWSFPAEAEVVRLDHWQQALAAAGPTTMPALAFVPLTKNDAHDAECSFSPDGKSIVFTSNRTGDLELFAMRADGSDPVQLTHTPGYDGGPFISPDGKRLVYRSDRDRNDLLQVFTSDLVFDASGKITGIENEKKITDDANVNWGPYWHPDGRHIIFASSRLSHANYELYMNTIEGGEPVRVTYAAGADVLPVFSPDGKFLLWASKRNGQTTQVYAASFRLP